MMVTFTFEGRLDVTMNAVAVSHHHHSLCSTICSVGTLVLFCPDLGASDSEHRLATRWPILSFAFERVYLEHVSLTESCACMSVKPGKLSGSTIATNDS